MSTRTQSETTLTSSPSLGTAFFFFFCGLAFAFAGSVGTLDAFREGELLKGVVSFVLSLLPGCFCLWLAYMTLRRRRIFGTSRLQLATIPVPLGGRLRARLQGTLPSDARPTDGLQVILTCYKKKSGWLVLRDKTSIHDSFGTSELDVPLSLDLPARPLSDEQEQSPATLSDAEKDALDDLDWSLKVRASFENAPDYKASFDFPVTVPDDLDDRTSADRAEERDSSTGAADDGAEEAFWAVEDEGTDADLRHTPAETSPAPDDAAEARSKPETDGIHVDRSGGGLTIAVDHDRTIARERGCGLMIPATIPIGIGAALMYTWTEGSVVGGLIGLLLVIPGGLLLRNAWRALTHDSRITVQNGQVELAKGPYFLPESSTHFSCDAVTAVRVKEPFGLYKVLIERETGSDEPEELVVMNNLAERAEANWIAARIEAAAEGKTDPA